MKTLTVAAIVVAGILCVAPMVFASDPGYPKCNGDGTICVDLTTDKMGNILNQTTTWRKPTGLKAITSEQTITGTYKYYSAKPNQLSSSNVTTIQSDYSWSTSGAIRYEVRGESQVIQYWTALGTLASNDIREATYEIQKQEGHADIKVQTSGHRQLSVYDVVTGTKTLTNTRDRWNASNGIHTMHEVKQSTQYADKGGDNSMILLTLETSSLTQWHSESALMIRQVNLTTSYYRYAQKLYVYTTGYEKNYNFDTKKYDTTSINSWVDENGNPVKQPAPLPSATPAPAASASAATTQANINTVVQKTSIQPATQTQTGTIATTPQMASQPASSTTVVKK